MAQHSYRFLPIVLLLVFCMGRPATAQESQRATENSRSLYLFSGHDRIDRDRIGIDQLPLHEVDVALLDTGIDASHPQLHQAVENQVSVLDGKPQSHRWLQGTHVAGIIGAAPDRKSGYEGVAPGVKLHDVQIRRQGRPARMADLIAGLEWVLEEEEQEADIVYLGVSGPINASPNEQELLHETIQRVVNQGITVVTPAGDQHENLQDLARIPASYDETIAVSALHDTDGERTISRYPRSIPGHPPVQEDSLAPFSNYGDAISIMAPGTGIVSTIPDRRNRHARILGVQHGTAQAAGFVTGAIALYMAASDGTPAPEMIRQQLRKTGQQPLRGNWPNDPDGVAEPLLNLVSLLAGKEQVEIRDEPEEKDEEPEAKHERFLAELIRAFENQNWRQFKQLVSPDLKIRPEFHDLRRWFQHIWRNYARVRVSYTIEDVRRVGSGQPKTLDVTLHWIRTMYDTRHQRTVFHSGETTLKLQETFGISMWKLQDLIPFEVGHPFRADPNTGRFGS